MREQIDQILNIHARFIISEIFIQEGLVFVTRNGGEVSALFCENLGILLCGLLRRATGKNVHCWNTFSSGILRKRQDFHLEGMVDLAEDKLP
jgi:hypothetical protein